MFRLHLLLIWSTASSASAHDCSGCAAKEVPSGWVSDSTGCQCLTHTNGDHRCLAPWNVAPFHEYACGSAVVTSTTGANHYHCGLGECTPSNTTVTTTTVSNSSALPTCTNTFPQMWTSLPANERIFIVDEAYAPGPGWDMRIQCLPKGQNNELLDPFMETKLHMSMFWQFGRMACANPIGGIPTGKVQASSSCYSQAQIDEYFDKAGCQYPISGKVEGIPSWASSLTGLTPRHWPQQSSWFGPLMLISTINGEDTSNTAKFGNSDVISHSLPAGVDTVGGTSCSIATGGSDAGDGYASEAERIREQRQTWYHGGVMGSVKRGEYLTTRSFHFSSDAAKNAAKAVANDTTNPGLKYAKTYTGRNGCDVEIVMEFKPAEGGGLSITANIQLESLAKETEAALRESVKAYQTDEEIVVLAGYKQVRDAQFVPYNESCEPGNVELIRFSKSFVCKGTGQSVRSKVYFHRANGATQAYISDNPLEPTAFQTNPPTTLAYHTDGTTVQIPKFSLTMTDAEAPESCGTMYWDPVLSSLTFDNAGANKAPGPIGTAAPNNNNGAGQGVQQQQSTNGGGGGNSGTSSNAMSSFGTLATMAVATSLMWNLAFVM